MSDKLYSDLYRKVYPSRFPYSHTEMSTDYYKLWPYKQEEFKQLVDRIFKND